MRCTSSFFCYFLSKTKKTVRIQRVFEINFLIIQQQFSKHVRLFMRCTLSLFCLFMSKKKRWDLYRKFCFSGGAFHPYPRSQEGNLKLPEGRTPYPADVAEARMMREVTNGDRNWGPRAGSAAQNNFQNPRTCDGVLGKIHGHKPEFCTYFFLNPGDIKTFSIYPITLHLYMDEYTLQKTYLDSLCLAEVFIIKFTVTKTLF